MTIHAAKGKEFDHVILQGLAEDYIPSFQSKKRGDTSPEMEEERRNAL
jgi:DNA helicase-2/ATP-dependent DNA helicase PcrA